MVTTLATNTPSLGKRVTQAIEKDCHEKEAKDSFRGTFYPRLAGRFEFAVQHVANLATTGTGTPKERLTAIIEFLERTAEGK